MSLVYLLLLICSVCKTVFLKRHYYEDAFAHKHPNSTRKFYFLDFPYFPQKAPFQAMPYETHEEKEPEHVQWYQFVKKGRKKKQKKKKQFFTKLNKYYKKCGIPFNIKLLKKSDLKEPLEVVSINQLPALHKSTSKNIMKHNNLNGQGFMHLYVTRTNGTQNPKILKLVYPKNQSMLHRVTNWKHQSRVRPPLRPFYATLPRNRWKTSNRWYVAPPGKKSTEFVLEESIPGSVGGTPPLNPIFKINQDKRIPISEAFVDNPKFNNTARSGQQIKYYFEIPVKLNKGEYWKEHHTTSINYPKKSNPYHVHYSAFPSDQNSEVNLYSTQPSYEFQRTTDSQIITEQSILNFNYYSVDNFPNSHIRNNVFGIHTNTTSFSVDSQPQHLIKELEREIQTTSGLLLKSNQGQYLEKTDITMNPGTSWVPIVALPEYYQNGKRNQEPTTESVLKRPVATTSLGKDNKTYLIGGFRNLSSMEYGIRLYPKVSNTSIDNPLIKCVISGKKKGRSLKETRRCKYSTNDRYESRKST